VKPQAKPISRDAFLVEVAAWATRMRVQPERVTLRAMKRKWGSCSTKGRLTFDADLRRQHPEFRKRVMVEELLHLRVPNHSKLFKTLLRAYLRT